jgi:predicted metal-binding membrane protein
VDRQLHPEVIRPRYFLTFGALILSAWVVLVIWGQSPYAAWLDHARMDELPFIPILRLAVFAFGWTLMIVAMMLPGTLLLAYQSCTLSQLQVRPITQFILAYLAVWVMFGCMSYLADSALHEIVEHVPSLAGVIAPGVLLIVGAYQFTPWKCAYLSKCRRTQMVLNQYLPANNGQAWHLGFQHGTLCLGNCWALMLLMFAVGGANLVWMLSLGAVMATERTTYRGDLLARLVGIALIACSFLAMLR